MRHLVILFILLVSCEAKEDYESCPMTQKMIDDCKQSLIATTCSAQETECYISCKVVGHPHCQGKGAACMILNHREVGETDTYQSSSPFCTISCEKDADCPGDARCLKFIDGFNCVPNSLIIKK